MAARKFRGITYYLGSFMLSKPKIILHFTCFDVVDMISIDVCLKTGCVFSALLHHSVCVKIPIPYIQVMSCFRCVFGQFLHSVTTT